MHRHSSSTFSSEPAPGIRELVVVALWTCVALGMIDLVVGRLFRYPSDREPNTIESYFERGRSTEGKLKRMVGTESGGAESIAERGWLKAAVAVAPTAEGSPSITLYGNSFSNGIAKGMARSTNAGVRSVSAPLGSPAWAFAAFELDDARPDVVVLTVLGATVPMLRNSSPMSWYFVKPYPYMQPLYSAEEGALVTQRNPPFDSLSELRAHLFDDQAWEDFRANVLETEPSYDAFLFRDSFADRSVLVRLLRRGWHESQDRNWQSSIFGVDGFNADSEEAKTLVALVVRFATKARERGAIPLIFLVNDQTHGTYLFDFLGPELAQRGIPYFSTHEICPPDDPRNFAGGGHFSSAKNVELAQALLRQIKAILNR